MNVGLVSMNALEVFARPAEPALRLIRIQKEMSMLSVLFINYVFMDMSIGITIVVMPIFLLLDIYLYQAVKLILDKRTSLFKNIIGVIYWTTYLFPFLAFWNSALFHTKYISLQLTEYLVMAGLLLYLSKLFSVIIFFTGDIIRSVRWGYNRLFNTIQPRARGNSKAKTVSRSKFLAKSALAVGGLHVGALSWGVISGANDYQVRKIRLNLMNLPQAFDGVTIAQISDMHVGSFYNKTAVQGGIDLLNSHKPDIVFFTGDLVNDQAKEIKGYFDVLKNIKSELGVYSSLGNHDYGDYSRWPNAKAKAKNFEDMKKAQELLGWDLLIDEHRRVKVDNEEIGILGIQNWGVGGSRKYGDLEKVMSHTDDLPVKLLLSHDPSHWRAQVLDKTDIDVAFAGHTHGMQYGVEIGNFKFSPAQFGYKEWAGLYHENNQQLYVNRGFGFINYPGRLGILPEITIFELKKA